jgi:hypothetical protein
MIRFTWMQFRVQALLALGGLAIVAIVLGLTGPNLVHLYDTSGITTCGARGDCSAIANTLLSHYRLLQDLGTVLLVVPALVGLFWGAPLVTREFETGTFRLVWTQGITRTHWMAIKLTIVGLASMAVAGLLSLMVTWWSSPLDRANPNQFSELFAERGIVAIGYAAFAFALGVTVGLLIRRTIPAMATTLVAYVIVRLGVTKLRPHFQAPITLHEKLATTAQGVVENVPGPGAATPPHLGDWVLSSNVLDASGQPFNATKLNCSVLVTPGGTTPSPSSAASACLPRIREYSAGLRQVITYQPSNRYWPFQCYETAIFIGLALVLAGFCFWWIRRRLA